MLYVKLVNRSSKVLQGIWDGRQYDLAPGAHSFPEVQANKFKEQNPVMGSQNPYTLEKQYLIGIEENGDDCSPLEQSTAPQLTDRSLLQNQDPVKLVKGEGLFAYRDKSRLPTNPAFEAPGA